MLPKVHLLIVPLLVVVSIFYCCQLVKAEDLDKEPFRNLSIEEACAVAEKEGKVVMIDFFSTACDSCQMLNQTTWKDERVHIWLQEKIIAIRIDINKEAELSNKYHIKVTPTIIFLKSDGKEIQRLIGYQDPAHFLSEMEVLLATDRKPAKQVPLVFKEERPGKKPILEPINQALKRYLETLAKVQAAGDQKEEAFILHNIGKIYSVRGEWQQALEYYGKALSLERALANQSGEASALRGFGEVYLLLRDYQKALEYYEKALSLSHTVSDHKGEARALYKLGTIYEILRNKTKSLEYFEKALLLNQGIDDHDYQVRILNSLSDTYTTLRNYPKTLEYYEKLLSLHRATGNKFEEASTLNSISNIYLLLDQPQRALDSYEKVLKLSQATKNQLQEAIALQNIGSIYLLLGEKEKALDYLEEALPLHQESGYKKYEAITLYTIGKVYLAMLEYQKALEYFQKALTISQTVSDRRVEAYVLTGIGSIYSLFGEKKKALEVYEKALLLSQAVHDQKNEAICLHNIGSAYSSLGEYQKALVRYEKALSLNQVVGDRSGEAAVLHCIGNVYASLKEYQKALTYSDKALSLSRLIGNRKEEAHTLESIGHIYCSLKEYEKAKEYFEKALPISQEVDDKVGEISILYDIAQVEHYGNNFATALDKIKEALNLIESFRTKIYSHELRASYLTTMQNCYALCIHLLMHIHQLNPNTGYNAEALQISERARARGLIEMLVEAHADIRKGVDPQLIELEKAFQKQLNAQAQYQMQLFNSKHTKQQLEETQKKITGLKEELQKIELKLYKTNSRYADLKHPEPLNLSAIQQQLDANTLLLEYTLEPNYSYLWVVTSTSLTSFQLPGREQIEKAALRVYKLLTARERQDFETEAELLERVKKADNEYWQAAAELSQMLLGPIAQQLDKKRLLIVSEGILQYVPFAALPIPKTSDKLGHQERARGRRLTCTEKVDKISDKAEGRYSQSSDAAFLPLIVNHEIVTLPSASTLAVLRRELAGRKPAGKTVAIFANPVFSKDDQRVKSVNGKSAISQNGTGKFLDRLKALPETEEMAKNILSFVPAKESKLALGFNANLATATSEEISDYRIIHYATHGFLNTNPELSGIVLSLVNEDGTEQNGFLSAPLIFNLGLSAELVILSACQTGLALDIRENKTEPAIEKRFDKIKSYGLVGLARGFMYAGAARVLVSLWKIRVKPTTELMIRFYRNMLGAKRLSPAAALRAAQLEMWKQPQWQSPYYWAGFVMSGEYK
ncbi:MAG: tetratricopeptide repeat protein [Acidobacteriota bacterium]